MGGQAPFVSIVVPTYRVPGYIRECLDSILSQGFRDFEVVAVDDCSPDQCGEILDEYAARDPRVRVLHLPENVGLGLARAAGLEASTGEYVWFVDSDDWLPEGSLRAVANRLRQTNADQVLFSFERVTPAGGRKIHRVTGPITEGDGPEVFSPVDHPAVFSMIPSAWVRVTRRALLVERSADLFSAGWYEDVAFSLPLLAAAHRITVLPRVCYAYRLRPGGITTVTSPRHFEVFEQYERLHATLDRWGIATDDPVRGHIWSRMIGQYLWVLRESERVPRNLRSAYFRKAHDHFRRWMPKTRPALAGRTRARTLARIERWLLGVGWFAGGEAFIALRKSVRQGRRLKARIYNFVRKIKRRVVSVAQNAYYRIQVRLPLDDNLAVYWNYWGQSYGCNPAAVYEKAKELVPSVRGVWLMKRGKETLLPPGTPYAIEGTFAYRRAVARAKYLITNVNFPQYVVKRPGSVHLQTHHGTPLKMMGMDHRRHPLGAQGMNLSKLLERCRRWDLSVSTSPFNTEVWQRSYPVDCETLEVGYPRNDRLHLATPDEIAALRESLGIEPGETAVLCVPTHREYTPGYAPNLEIEQFADDLGPQFRILARLHHSYAKEYGRYSDGHPKVVDVSAYPRVEDLYLAADVMITDYSSAMFDYAHLDRPIVIFAPDWDAYRLLRGVNFDLMAEPPGEVATNVADLIAIFRSGAFEGARATRLRAAFRERFCPHRHGRSAEIVVRRTFRDALPATDQQDPLSADAVAPVSPADVASLGVGGAKTSVGRE